jgi:hypothetical protein
MCDGWPAGPAPSRFYSTPIGTDPDPYPHCWCLSPPATRRRLRRRPRKGEGYRKHLRKQCEAHHTVRDICDYSKHGPNLDKRSKDQPVSVHDSELIVRQEGFSVGALLVLTQSREVERLEVRHKNGRTEHEVLKQVIASWNAIFDEDGL